VTRTVVIAAAGAGRRLSAESPKCMIKIGDHYILEYLLKAFEQFNEIRMVIGYKAEIIVKAASAIRKDIVFINNDSFDKSSGPLQSFYLGSIGLTGKVMYSVSDVIYSRNSAIRLFNEYTDNDEFVTVTKNISENPIFANVNNDSFLVQLSHDITSEFEFAGSAFIDCSKIENKQSFLFEQLNNYMPLRVVPIERLEIDTKRDLMIAEKTVSDFPEQYNFWS